MTKYLHYPAFIVVFAMFLVIAGFVPTVSGVEAGNSTLLSDNGTGQQLVVDFFYNPACVSCQEVLPVVEQYEANNPVISVHYINVVENQSNVEQFIQLQKYLGNPTLHVPVIVIGDRYLNGKENISEGLDNLVRDATVTKNNRPQPVSPVIPSNNVSSDYQTARAYSFFLQPDL